MDQPNVKIRRHVLDGTGASLLTEFSTAFDLIVVGSRGLGGFPGMLLGSTSQTVLNHAVCPIMVVTARVDSDDLYPTSLSYGRIKRRKYPLPIHHKFLHSGRLTRKSLRDKT